ncbi:toxin-antitoxin system, toxin component [Streptomyces fragilis]|uniref:Toxin-antitoxin system, toxin component n=2 Tax=Streptomyces fragilis TaxID=67301 RepID=A0ABV2YJX8_9ACTN|nr:toxin-antitoxin system, toxin component [Streptomyces fragilis]
MTELSKAVVARVDVPAAPEVVFRALCDAMSERRGRPVALAVRPFPPEIADTTGLWLDLADQDVIVIEEGLDADHQLVVLGHELWHMVAGHCGHQVGEAAVAARTVLTSEPALLEAVRRVAARSHSHAADERDAEGFGLLLGTRMRNWLDEGTGATPLDDIAQRIDTSLGYPGPKG